MSTRLKIAIQKSGRLQEDSLRILKECGIYIDNGKDQLKARAQNFPLEVLYLRNSDIPEYVQDGIADIAIVGENVVVEKQKKVQILQKLGFSKCRLAMAIPKDDEYNGLEYFQGKKLATSYPNSLKAFLDENNLNSEIHVISGSVEIAPNIGLSDGICDLVSSGSTLFKNGLKEVVEILSSQACLVCNENISEEKQAILNDLLFRMRAVLAAKNNKYVLLNAPTDKIEAISNILPGMKSPTVMPLLKEGWSSIHTVINENDFWTVIDQLKANGAEGILTIPIGKMIL
ncbi:ATP phosphoribosyltransferase [Ancylomarina euxinus]|uniref:ATP phosphoribosyltransferase n=1 Tax=Ancylomarina euxinus TaxID=2283627 RepID=A0A425Y4A8_9BACT|nr:ATP phosphoribosyltransferase [Ancylomarina euxinus]MCZ4694545.1 ATP phosphoribosyltransferase [Ancylomarina euxinus]MUP14088.1 ATP phosphoribosyltransferase [Ancylomarina euxinus]RRG22946.1 ATP phosphoribosyltransferase [Ancylomarina euxinus]